MEFSIYRLPNDDFILDGNKYTRNATFDNILKIVDLSNDPDFSGETKIRTGIYMLFGENFSDDYTLEELNLILENGLEEYLQSKDEIEYDDLGEPMPGPLNFNKKLMDIGYDAQAIYSSFLQAYGIDLHEEVGRLHWYKFKALLAGLPEKTRLREVISIRAYEKPSKSDNHHMQMLKLQREHALPAHIIGGSESDDDWYDEFDDEGVNGYGE